MAFRFNSLRNRFEGLTSGEETRQVWDEAARRENPTTITSKLPPLVKPYRFRRGTNGYIDENAQGWGTRLRSDLAQTAFNDAFDRLYPGVAEALPDNPRAAFLLGIVNTLPEDAPTASSLPSGKIVL